MKTTTHTQLAIFLLLGFIFSENLQAENYYWTQYRDGQAQNFPSAAAACTYPPVENSDHVVFSAAGFRVIHPGAVTCLQLATHPDGHTNGPESYRQLGANRSGDSCTANTIYDPVNLGCISSNGSAKGPSELPICTVSPIGPDSGNIFEATTDYKNNISSLEFVRAYNSLDGVTRHNYSTKLQVSESSVIRTTAQGKEFFYSVSGTSVTPGATDLGKLTKLSNGWLYTSVTGEAFAFDTNGQLTQQTSPTGQQLYLSYSGNTITVSDQFSQVLTITEDAQHQPLSLTAPGVTIQYSYDANEQLVEMARRKGGITEQLQYHYEDARNNTLLTGVTDERGVRIRSWAYDDQGRAISSQSAGGAGLTQVTYNSDGTSKVTNELGKSTLYRFLDTAGTKRVSAIEGEPSANCPASNSTFTYNDRGQVLTQTDAKGFITTYAYNERGLETSRTEASGTPQARTITTTWHATSNLPLTITEGGKVTTYNYDMQGRQTNRTENAP